MSDLKQNILVIDDDEDIRDVLEWALSTEGYEVRIASSRDAALKMIEEARPSFILMDLYMEGLKSQEFVSELKALKLTAPLILMTGAGDAATKAKSLGAEHFLPKPFDLDDLLTILRAHPACSN